MKKREYCKILILCGVLYMFCLFHFLGISLGGNGAGGQRADSKEAVKKTVDEDEASVDKVAPQIAITFDDGPSAGCTGRLLSLIHI